MPQSNTLSVGMDVHKDAIAVADIAQAHGAPRGVVRQRARDLLGYAGNGPALAVG